MGIIKQLSAAVINQIAAGEVVERPASVVKELLENAIDAGATRVDLGVERGGKDLIRVSDNGKGISPEDLPIAFLPHATSKLEEADDLFKIRTLGFRGEALAAIAEISKLRCQTRQADSEIGYEISIDAGVSSPIRECAAPIGSVMEVRNLFFNIPVRRTFLKSDSTEAGHVAEMFARIALANPTVHFTYRSSGKLVHDLPAVTGVKERIGVFFGRELADSLLWVESKVDQTSLWGYVGHPSQSRSNNKSQFLFVAGRYVRDRSLGHALTEAYRGLLMVGRQPVAFLHLDIPPEEVDVNVHPTKIEVRFRDGHKIYSQLLSTLRSTFLSSDLHSRLQAPLETELSHAAWTNAQIVMPEAPEPPPLRLHAEPNREDVSSWFTPSKPSGFQTYPSPGYAGGPASVTPSWAARLPDSPASERQPSFNELLEPEPLSRSLEPTENVQAGEPMAESVVNAREIALPPRDVTLKAIQVHDTYLVAETADGMVVIDQHALHERILYEELKARVLHGGVEAQRLLVPEPVDLSAAEATAVLERRDVLAKLGLEVEPFGGDTVLVSSTPAMLRGVTPERLLRDLADHFRSSPLPPAADAVLEDVLNMVACKAAVKANQYLAPEEIAALLDRRHLVGDSHHCPHGRPTALVFTKAELEKQFGRI
jgi:DNA mismatch repair protein MutL